MTDDPDATVGVAVRTANTLPAETWIAVRLRSLLGRHDLDRYAFTETVVIEDGAIPHSHPALTLGTSDYADDNVLLAEYVHEQLHWFLTTRASACEAAIDELAARYPEVPIGFPDGARDEHSTYLHLVLCPIEYLVIADLVGRTSATDVIRFWQGHHYRWIYRTVERDLDQLTGLVERHGLLPDGLR